MAATGGGAITYHLNDTANFGIDNTGVIYTLRRLDHEGSDGYYILQVTADERGKYTWLERQNKRLVWGSRKGWKWVSVYSSVSVERVLLRA